MRTVLTFTATLFAPFVILQADEPRSLVPPFNYEDAESAQDNWAKFLGIDDGIQSSIGIQFKIIPPGEFRMGGDQSPQEIARLSNGVPRDYRDEQPQHVVHITEPFAVSTFEVTQGEWEAVMRVNASWFASTGAGFDAVAGLDTSRFPVDTVSWYDAIVFCNRLSELDGLVPYYRIENAVEEQTPESSQVRIVDAELTIVGGNGYRLLTEAEWEYACRAGSTGAFHFGATSNGQQSNVNGELPYSTETTGPNIGRPVVVGTYEPNAFGLYDMHGNVWEWCWDAYDRDLYADRREIVADPRCDEPPLLRVLRGGSWRNAAKDSRSADRYGNQPRNLDSSGGLRIARYLAQ